MKRATKVAQIMALYDGVRTTREIADQVGCKISYVRVVARQRKGHGTSDIDRRYLAKPGVYEYELARKRAYYHRRKEARA